MSGRGPDVVSADAGSASAARPQDENGGMRSREQQFRYLAVGGLNTLFSLGVFAALDLTTARYVGHYVVLTLAAVISIATAHTTQRKWAWLSQAPYFNELARFSSVYLVGYLLNLALLYTAHSGFGAPVIPTQVAITGLLTLGTFFVHRFWTFAPPRLRG
jgi:putative flippase GtrA